MFHPFYYFTSCFSSSKIQQIEQSPSEKNTSITQTSSNRGRPLSSSSRRGGHSFKVEINLTRILSLKRKNTAHPELPVSSSQPNLESMQYKKTVAKRWRQRRDHALENGQLFYGDYRGDFQLLAFRHFTNNVSYLYSCGFQELSQVSSSGATVGFLLKKGQHVYLSKDVFKSFFAERYGITLFRSPCEAYVILPERDGDLIVVKIVEKKAQIENSGSFEPKIWSSISLKKEYEITLGERFHVEYAVCLNSVLEVQYKNLNIRKSNIIQALMQENKVPLFFGEQPDYLRQLNAWTQFR